MNKLVFTYNNQELALTSDGHAVYTTPPADAKPGRWRTELGTNRIEVTLPGLGSVNVEVDYTFNARNQLQLAIPAQDRVLDAAGPEPFAGRIHVDDPQDLTYICVDDDGMDRDFKIAAYGTFHFDSKTDRLLFTPTGEESATEIRGLVRNRNNVVADISTRPSLTVHDLLQFKAATANTLAGKPVVIDAIIEFVGKWDLYEGKLAFVAEYDSTGAKPSTFVAFGGSIKGVDASLVYSDGPDGKILFNIAGKFQFNQTTGQWDAALGYANNTLSGSLSLNASSKIGVNGKLDLAGKITLKQKGGGKMAIDLKLAARYEANGNRIDSWVEYQGGVFELMLAGKVNIGAAGDVDFQVNYAPNKPNEKLTLKLGNWNTDSKLKVTLNAILSKKGLTVATSSSFRVRWEDGFMVPA